MGEDQKIAHEAVVEWFRKTPMHAMRATLEYIVIEETINADNPEPAAMYTEADLVSFGNFMALKVLKASGSAIVESDMGSYVWDSDIANWRHEKELKEISGLGK
jgi:hypothetical protein